MYGVCGGATSLCPAPCFKPLCVIRAQDDLTRPDFLYLEVYSRSLTALSSGPSETLHCCSLEVICWSLASWPSEALRCCYLEVFCWSLTTLSSGPSELLLVAGSILAALWSTLTAACLALSPCRCAPILLRSFKSSLAPSCSCPLLSSMLLCSYTWRKSNGNARFLNNELEHVPEHTRQTDTHTHGQKCTANSLVWSSLRLAPTIVTLAS